MLKVVRFLNTIVILKQMLCYYTYLRLLYKISSKYCFLSCAEEIFCRLEIQYLHCWIQHGILLEQVKSESSKQT
jgi:hypothetical protein